MRANSLLWAPYRTASEGRQRPATTPRRRRSGGRGGSAPGKPLAVGEGESFVNALLAAAGHRSRELHNGGNSQDEGTFVAGGRSGVGRGGAWRGGVEPHWAGRRAYAGRLLTALVYKRQFGAM